MELILKKSIKSPIIIEAFPGVGLIGSITTEYLTNHLKCEEVGQIIVDDVPPLIAIHSEKIIKPITLFYNKKNNLLIVHSISPVRGIEWKISELVLDLIKKTQAKQIISIDGISSRNSEGEGMFYYTNSQKIANKMKGMKFNVLKESIIMGVTAAIMSKIKKDFLGVFAETHINLPDSRAAARVIEILDQYLGLNIDYKPLIKKAEMFEKNLNELMEESKKAVDLQDEKKVNYFG
ncbi:PAC2 family protein [Candidatus Woesearchaeota archaeon]|nr:PAC2 family protein [Candidatus Woesearchaeota archaeon]